jgi:protein-disulfide isomerase
MSTGIVMGPDDAPVKIIEFMDFQCPPCAAWAKGVELVWQENPGLVQVTMHHFPIVSRHPYAMEAAVAAECADMQGSFRDFSKALFSQQMLIGVKPWREFAVEVGVEDLAAFETCVSFPSDSFPRISYGLELARSTGAQGTPTVWVNGTLGRPTLEQFRELTENLARH